ncbi:MAG: tRNA (5-methylaminomethyl-2-thiouridine)(34)-methyltransferase MnmD [Reichenbachiella sp.]
MPKVEIFETKDGSHSLLLPEMNETYHSTHGARTESEYVFTKMGLDKLMELHPDQKEIRILEIGFGTGLNPLLNAVEAEKRQVNIEFTSMEKFPLDDSITSKLNYATSPEEKDIYDKLHQAEWNTLVKLTDHFSLHKMEVDIMNFAPLDYYFDLIYFDAFAPSKQPEMWTPEILTKMYSCQSIGGVFSTYCAQGQFKRDLKSVGYLTEELPGPPGKKEMTRGIKQ